jgi:hypothetical protein
MGHIGNKLRELLTDPELRQRLASAFHAGMDVADSFEQFSLADHIRHARGIAVEETPFEDLPDRLKEVLQSLVIDRLPQPPPITIEDLSSLAVDHLAGIELSQFDEQEIVRKMYERFVTCTILEIEQQWQSDSYSLGQDWDLPEEDSALAAEVRENNLGFESSAQLLAPSNRDIATLLEHEDYEKGLWSSPSGFSFLCRLGGAWVDVQGREIVGVFTGYCTERALQYVASELGQFVESVGKTVRLCGPSFPPQNFLTHGFGGRVLAACLSACCQPPAAQHATMLDRLRNAVHLLSHSDATEADPISLSLSFAAIEALICEKDEVPVNKQIKRHVSTLLVQNVSERQKRGKVLGRLYNVRCEVMHGNAVSASAEAARIVRQIAAGVIRGIVHWIDNQERAGAEATWKEFMDEINAASRKPDIVVGVPDLSNLIPDKLPN